ncbi:MAG: PD40 domain-containing protein [Rikenellaceae bacterium]|nr:PD40 domain-containing protein [Rikenellaceae bacterium]
MRKIFILIVTALVAVACSTADKRTSDQLPPIFPDYAGVTIPVNIAPLNFDVTTPAKRVEATISNGTEQIVAKGREGVRISPRKWRALLAEAERLTVTVAVTAEGVCTQYTPFEIEVSRDSIDYGLCYRRIDPGYEYYARMGLYYYDLAENEEHILIENTLLGSSCVNCHSFAKTDPSKMMFHIRGKGGGTLMHLEGENKLLNTKTDATRVSCVYPSWHPEGRYIAYSINDIKQTFHNVPSKLLDVYDYWSDVVIYDTKTGQLNTYPILSDTVRMETFPSFSADGRTLYFCSAEPNTVSLPEVQYELCSVAFDPETGEVGDEITTVWDGEGTSLLFPRASYDGRYLMVTRSAYGTFPIWHKDADLWLIDLATGERRALDELNSDNTESYHSWSSSSRWVVFSSRRIDGLHTRPFIAHVDDEGRFSKPFLLPQNEPTKWYEGLMQSYNIPEFISAPIDISPRDILDAEEGAVELNARK